VKKLKKGQVINRSYLIEDSLSERGGTASVYLAGLVEKPQVKVAIKFARTDGGGAAEEDVLLRHEAELLSKPDWHHPGILRLYPLVHMNKTNYVLKAAGVEGEPSYMAMEYLRGKSMAENLDKILKYSFDWKIEFLYQLAIDLAFIHSKQYGHRDIKPDNIVFRDPISPDRVPQPVLVDFALCCNGSEPLRLIENSYTLEYAGPERVMQSVGLLPDNIHLDATAQDIWSFGVVAYELFTGGLPFKGDANEIRTTLISNHLDASFIKDHPKLPEFIARFVRAIMQPDPTKRPDIFKIINLIEQRFRPPRL
jgi:serine/threonine protein kinase